MEFRTFQIKYDCGLYVTSGAWLPLYVNIVSISKLKIVTLAPKSHPITDTQNITQLQVQVQRKINLGRVECTSSVSNNHFIEGSRISFKLFFVTHNVSMQSQSDHFRMKKTSFAIYILQDFKRRIFYPNIEISRTKIS